MKKGSDNRGGGAQATQERYVGQVEYRDGRLDVGPGDADFDGEALDVAPMDGAGRPSLADLDVLAEPTFPTDWLDQADAPLADHPLLRGLLLELPPRGAVPPPGWLDRWFEAARSILELLYVTDAQLR